MLSTAQRQQIIQLVRRQVVPAIGCTEPIGVALAVARARETLGQLPARIEARLSANIIKNAMGVGIPGTSMVGLPIAIALGALYGRSDLCLEVLRDCPPDAVKHGQEFIAQGRIHITQASETEDKLYIDVEATAQDGSRARALIKGSHTHFARIELNGEIIFADTEAGPATSDPTTDEEVSLTLRKVFDFATTTPLSEIDFINEAAQLNMEAARSSLQGNYGHCLGKALSRPLGRGIMGESIFSHILSATSCACDARMAGAAIPVMSNSGSGNQGICATNPVVVFANENHNTAEELTRALMLSHLTAIYIKQHLGPLSALCGCVVAATGSSCGITLLMGGGYEEVCASVKNMIANLTGMVCDGAKPSCALKLTTGVSTAVLSAMLAMQGNCVSAVEGIVDEDVDRTISNLVKIGAEAMNETDRLLLDIMLHKSAPHQ